MKKQLGVLASLLFLSASALLWVGCSENRSCHTALVCEQPGKPVHAEKTCAPVHKVEAVCHPVPACAPTCKVPVKCKHPHQNELQCLDGITVTASNPKMCMLGDQYPLDINIHACIDVCDVVVSTHLPEGVSFIRSEPEAKVDGRKLTWNIGGMTQGQCIAAKVWVKCETEGELCACFCATATPVRFCSLLCAKPVLTCEKVGPEQVCPGDTVHYTITVKNEGSCAAEDVVVTDNIPEGLEHSSCLRTLTYKLGTVEPCQTKVVNVALKAVKRGKITNTAVVTACNADSTSCQWTTCICCYGIECTKVGPKEQNIGKNADYQITVVNTGDLPLTDVIVVDTAPNATSIVAANGATINGNQAIWKLKEMKPGEKVSFNVTLTTCTPGCFTNRVNVTNCQNCNSGCESTTRWKGRASLCVQSCETEGNICIGDSTSYDISVINQGSEPDSNVSVVVKFPKELNPTAVSGDSEGIISGQTVTFTPVKNLAPRQTINFRVDGKAAESGDGRVQIEVSSDSIRTPIVQQESTIIN